MALTFRKPFSHRKILVIFFIIQVICLLPFFIGDMAIVHEKLKIDKD